MTTLNVCFTHYSVKSQPEVGLSQDLFDFGQLEHDFTINPSSIPIPPNAVPPDEYHVKPELINNGLFSFGSFSSAADSVVHDNAIVIPAYSPPTTPATTIQDFCLLDDQEALLNVSDPSLTLLSSSNCESDISFCSPTTPLSTMLSPYAFSMDDNMMSTSPGASSSSGTWLASSMENCLSLHSPQFNLMADQGTYGMYTTTRHMDDPIECKQEETTTTTPPLKKKAPARRREYTCPFCPRKSNRSNNMKEHILTHDPNRPKNFPCSICPKRFARKHDLKRHHQSHERNIEKMMVACGLVPHASS
ncbi:hypothetical protein BC941DRAFT_430572 [Chlamydoabsidia padenii]|nr:hypothetical protein BC941DRAFT_430572 [Chlamydoabsidia padenii]